MLHLTKQLCCLLVVVVFVSIGCFESDPVAIDSLNAAQTGENIDPVVGDAARPVTTPFSAFYETTFTPPLTPPPFLSFTIFGTGTATYLGRSSYEGPSVVDFTQIPPVQTGTGTFTAADGSTIDWIFEGISVPGPDEIFDVAGNGTYTLANGTGRFAGATGSGTYDVIASNSLVLGQVSINGTITFSKPPVTPPGHRN